VTNPARNSLHDILTALQEAHARSQGQLDADKAVQALRGLARPSAFKGLLERLTEDAAFLEQVATKSYPHVLGFDKIPLTLVPPLGRLRMHVWWPDLTPRPVEHPHNHRFPSHSVIVIGKLRTHVHEQGDKGTPVVHYQELEIPGQDHSKFLRLGKSHLSTMMNADIVSGATYSMSADVVHRIEAPRELTVTIFLEMERTRRSSDIFVRDGDLIPDSQVRQYFSPLELRERLLRLARQFSSS
jgi:hypothetical protein